MARSAALELTGDGLVSITYTAEPDSATAEALRFLSNWATQHAGDAADHPTTS